jgi:cytochrome bd-type quinol oxidase subunit 2
MEPTNPTLLLIHSTLRYVVLAMLIVLIIKSLIGWLNKSAYTQGDNRISLFTLIVTHIQFLAGFILYFFSIFVQFNENTMKDDTIRYWTMEHAVIMLIAIVLITVARSTSKKIADGPSRHKRLFMLNTLALFLVLVGIQMSGRGIL